MHMFLMLQVVTGRMMWGVLQVQMYEHATGKRKRQKHQRDPV